MTRLTWGETNPMFETGIDRGVFYPEDGSGIAWPGLIRVEESFIGGESTSHYYDGIKYLESVSPKNYQAVITAFSAPQKFLDYLGYKEILPGLILTRQPRKRFGLSYRTLLGNNSGYKIHLVYNALASSSGKTYSSLGSETNPLQHSWKIDAIPPSSATHRPSAHFVIDSTKTDQDTLDALELLLYGSESITAQLPNIIDVIDLVSFWAPLTVESNTTTGLSSLSTGTGDLSRISIPGLLKRLPTTRLQKAPFGDGFYRMES